MSSPYEIRLIGDPVLRERSSELTEIDGRLARLADDMVTTMYDASGVGLAAPQVGVQKRLFVYDTGEGPQAIVNPEVREARGEWTYEEGCLSIPGLYFTVIRAKEIHLVGFDLDGQELSIEANEYSARCFQHELDHLDGVLFIDRLNEDDRKAAMKIIREQKLQADDHLDADIATPNAARGRFTLR
ncbi:MAG: peptide deformylase [Acidimicrobiia bacterium]|nr:peptide deformylase [Acidimicrobiia bacterium]